MDRGIDMAAAVSRMRLFSGYIHNRLSHILEKGSFGQLWTGDRREWRRAQE